MRQEKVVIRVSREERLQLWADAMMAETTVANVIRKALGWPVLRRGRAASPKLDRPEVARDDDASRSPLSRPGPGNGDSPPVADDSGPGSLPRLSGFPKFTNLKASQAKLEKEIDDLLREIEDD